MAESSERDGKNGSKSKRGARGATGERGVQGPPGPAGPSATRADILAVVQDEFNEVRKHLHAQLARTAQMQAQLDTIQALVKQCLEKA